MATRKVKDTQLYDLLGVSPEATDIEYARCPLTDQDVVLMIGSRRLIERWPSR
jgi:hypothetical protein